MFFELNSKEYEKVRSIFSGIDYQLTIRAVIENTSPGKVFVDDKANPKSAFMCSVEGYYLAGTPDNHEFNASLKDYILNTIFAGDTLRENDNDLVLCIHPNDWQKKFAAIFPTRSPLQMQRIYYQCKQLKLNWKDKIPADFTVKRITSKLLNSSDLDIPDHIYSWMQLNWGSIKSFLQNGFGFCTILGKEVVSWCLTDCVSEVECEIGIRTKPQYRRRGLASLTAAATVDYALSSGFEKIGWHTNEENLGSIGVAENVGFKKSREYIWHYCMLDEATHLAETGLRQFLAKQFDQASISFEVAFQKATVGHWYYHYAALTAGQLEDAKNAIRYLNQAVDRGWTNFEHTESCEAFSFIHGTPAWKNVLARMKKKIGSN